jgi:hypothetical protein
MRRPPMQQYNQGGRMATNFISDIMNSFNVNRSQVMNIFDQVSKNRNDLMDYMQSNG